MQFITGIPRNTQLKYFMLCKCAWEFQNNASWKTLWLFQLSNSRRERSNHWEGNSQHIKWIELDVIYAGGDREVQL